MKKTTFPSFGTLLREKAYFENKRHESEIMLLKNIVLAISLSIDSFGVGMSYRIKGVKITFLAKVILGIMSFGITFLALNLGEWMVQYFPPDILRILGTAILVLIGITFIHRGIQSKEEAFCDMDHSSSIELWEAILLGFALSSDTISTCIAIATFPLDTRILPLFVGILQAVFLDVGSKVAVSFGRFTKNNARICGIFSGVLLIFLAILQNV
ncbi:manganese efflux pump [Velocimicrobium porci]|uniref:Sporulation protein YtaF n=1 Tax=Velocimicrobium porci TaxID=2606634 RepID=A0A6L5XXK3_9FIRM|nr:manganese efflux pump [Velocimicrobium porci]MSS63485.1 hypothetical protein [Velocimicrobium porci]